MKRILIVKFWALGDILMATPLLRALKRQWPDCEIAWLVDQAYAQALHGNPLLNEIIPLDTKAWRRAFRYGNLVEYGILTARIRRDLTARRFDIVINLTAEKWWSLWLNLAPLRIGLFPRARPGLVGRFYTEAIPRSFTPLLHTIEHCLLPARALGIPEPFDARLVVGITESDAALVDRYLEGQRGGHPRRPFIILHPRTSQAARCWPTANYAAVAAALADRFDIVITGSPAERGFAEAIRDAVPRSVSPPWIAAGSLETLGQSAALIARAAGLVTGDTSVVHVASALGVPQVIVYGSTRGNMPLSGRNAILYDATVACAPCYKADCPLSGEAFMRCVKAISPERVLAELERLLQEV